jgi:hypothetical protein
MFIAPSDAWRHWRIGHPGAHARPVPAMERARVDTMPPTRARTGVGLVPTRRAVSTPP